MPNQAALSCRSALWRLPVAAVLDLGDCVPSMAPCCLVGFGSASWVPVQRHPVGLQLNRNGGRRKLWLAWFLVASRIAYMILF